VDYLLNHIKGVGIEHIKGVGIGFPFGLFYLADTLE